MIQATIKGISTLQKDLKAEEKRKDKALDTSVKVESYRLRTVLKKEIRSGAPGGRQVEPLTFLARRKRGSSRFSPNKPLQKLAAPIMYDIQRRNPLTIAIGWTGSRVSQSWKNIAAKLQQGFTKSVTDPQESYFRHRGEEISDRSQNKKFFFLRKTTTALKTPARPVIDPFYSAHQLEAWKNIRSNFQLKMKGQRI